METTTLSRQDLSFRVPVALAAALLVLTGCGGGSSTGSESPSIAAPVAAFTSAPASPTAGQAVQFTDASTGSVSSWSWNFGDGATSTDRSPRHTYLAAGTFTVTFSASGAGGSTTASRSVVVTAAPGPGGPGVMNITNTISDQAQSATIAFDGLAFVTGSFCAQTFYPPGKVADFFGFQYLRDNDPSNLGHNTEFTTLTADPVLAILTDAQVSTFVGLAQAEQALSDEYGYARFPLAKAFRRLADADLPSGTTGLDRAAVKAYSASLFAIDGEMSLLRARAYASVLGSMDASQKAVLDAMKGKGAADWAQPSTEPAALRTYGQYSVQLRTYAGEMLAWYVGNTEADVYFCPERQGTYFGSFFMKDVKAMHNPNYTISSNMTAEMGDAFLAALDTTQRATITALVSQQKADLLALVAKRDEISVALRALLASGGTVSDAAVLALARQYGELDGEISYFYATAFSEVGRGLTDAQRATLLALRKTATAETGGTSDYDATCGNGFLYSAPLSSPPVIASTDFLFGSTSSSSMTLSSTAFADGGRIASTYTCDGTGLVPPIAWSGAPAGTVEYALTLTTVALDGTKYNWVLYRIPAVTNSIVDGTSVGISGKSTDGSDLRYYAPCSTGPGDKTYVFTLYALSGSPSFSVPAAQVDGPALEAAISGMTLGSQQLSFVYARQGL
jgi:PKD repeat protein